MNVKHFVLSIHLLCATSIFGYTKPNTYTVMGETYQVLKSSHGFLEEGVASWYGQEFHGNNTANGSIFDMHKLSMAHKTLPLGTWVIVTNLENGQSLKVQVNDRGPFLKNRIADLSYAAAKELSFIKQGTTRVRISSIDVATSTKASLQTQVGAFKSIKNATGRKQLLKNLLKKSAIEANVKILKKKGIYRVILKTSPINKQGLINLLNGAKLNFTKF